MTEDGVTLRIFLAPGADDGIHLNEVESLLRHSIPPEAELTIAVVNSFLSIIPEPNELVEAYPERAALLRSFLNADDYKSIERDFGDLSGLTWGDVERYGFARGGGGPGTLYDFVVKALSTDAPLALGVLTSLTVIIKTLIDQYFQKDAQRVFKLRHGENEIDLSGYSREEAKQLADEFFTKVTRNKLSK